MAYIAPTSVPSPEGFPDFNSYQVAVIAAFALCPPPFDPACEDPRAAAISAALNAWVTDRADCRNVVCDSMGRPISPLPAAIPGAQPGAPGGAGASYSIVPGVFPGAQPGGAAAPGAPYSGSPGVRPGAQPGGAVGGSRFHPRFLGAAGGLIAAGAGGPFGIAVAVASIIGSILGGLFGGLFGGSDFGKQIDQLKQVMVDIGNALTAAVTAVMHAMGSILKFLKGIWDDIIHPLIDALKKVVEQLGHLFRDILPKIVEWVRKIRQRILDLYERFVRPVILILQRVHTILTILAAFHIKWAARLDRQLQQLQAAILKPMLWLLGQINGIVNVFNWILDFKMLIQRTLLINSLFATAGTWTGMFYNVQTGALTYDDVQALADTNQVPTPDQTQADAQQYRDTGTGPLADLAGVGQLQAMQVFGGGV